MILLCRFERLLVAAAVVVVVVTLLLCDHKVIASFHYQNHHPTPIITTVQRRNFYVVTTGAAWRTRNRPSRHYNNYHIKVDIHVDTTGNSNSENMFRSLKTSLPLKVKPTTATTRRTWMTKSLITTGLTIAANTVTSDGCRSNAASLSPSSSSGMELLSQRLQSSILHQPIIGVTTTNANGNDMTIYPYYLEGTWQVTQTLTNIETPMGLKYAGGPNGIIEIAQKSINESSSRIGIPVSLQLRYIQCLPKDSNKGTTQRPVVLEDRLYNTRQRLNQFAGTNVVANVEYTNTKASNREIMNAQYSSVTAADQQQEQDVPLTTAITYFKGPAAQKVFVLGHHDKNISNMIPNQGGDICTWTDEKSRRTWTGYEYQRSLFALTNGSTAPPITTDTELIFQYTPVVDCSIKNDNNNDVHHMRGKLRIVGYLNPNDKFYFEVKNRAVTIQDYTLDMRRIR